MSAADKLPDLLAVYEVPGLIRDEIAAVIAAAEQIEQILDDYAEGRIDAFVALGKIGIHAKPHVALAALNARLTDGDGGAA